MTRTLAPSGACPAPSDELPEIAAISPGTGIIEGFEPQILEYLNAGGSADGLRTALGNLKLDDGSGTTWQARAQVVPVDVTGNGTPDVVVALVFFVEGQYADGALFVFGCREGQHEGGAVTPLAGQVFAPDPGIRAIQDMNGDGVPEIVLSYVEVMGTHGNFARLFRVLEWDGREFVDLVLSDSPPLYAAPVSNGDGAVLDTNGNKNLELVLSNGLVHYYEDGGPQRARTDIWAWNGYAFKLARSEFEPAAYRFQAIQDGDNAALAGNYDRALALYEQSVLDDQLLGWSQGQLWPDSAYGGEPTPTPDPDERARLNAYARYRTMLVHVLRGALEEAQDVYEALQADFPDGVPGHSYAELAAAFWQVYVAGSDINGACARAIEYAAAHDQEVLTPLGSSFYGYHNRDYMPVDVCPHE